MAFSKKPVTGMRDILPPEKITREKIINIIRETYAGYGFTEIETPLVEHMENLRSRQGGENEKLIFKVLKRGEKLQSALENLLEENESREGINPESTDALCEEGLRYDLTVPLCRYYAANLKALPSPFKALQIGSVFRADRPQKGRFRQFTQCDIDILGDATSLAEKELILATADALDKIGFSRYNFYIVINDRRLLLEMIKNAGLFGEDPGNVLIILDKLDKIGYAGVKDELTRAGFKKESIDKLISILKNHSRDCRGVRELALGLGSAEAIKGGENIADIMDFISSVSKKSINLVFDPSLVRGMGYYTGTIFEIKTDAFGSSVGGGGRYDRMIGRFIGRDVPAVGISIGFERIMSLIMEDGAGDILKEGEKSAWLIEKGMPTRRLTEIFDEALSRRASGGQILTVWMAKNKKFQKETLKQAGYTDIRDFYIEKLKTSQSGG